MVLKEKDRPLDYENGDFPDRRQHQTIELRPNNQWWTKVTLPLIFALMTQAGGIIWWAAGVEAQQEDLRADFERNVMMDSKRYEILLKEIKDNRNLIYSKLIEK